MTRLLRRTHALGWLLLIGARETPSLACATCGCGDPTLTAMGAEKPFENRLRVSVDLRHRADEIGQPGVDQVRLRETRLDGQVAWAPHERVFLLGTVPLLARSVRYVNSGETNTVAMGDVELRAKTFVYLDRLYAPRHLFAVVAGLKVPTAPRQRSETDGAYLPIEAQPGTGSWDPILGMSYAFFAHPVSLYASVQASAPAKGTSDFRASSSVRSSTSVQYQVASWLAPRVGIDTRLDGRAFERGQPERDSGGFIGFLSTELLIGSARDLLVVPSLRIPAVQALSGYHREGPIVGIALAYDL